MRSVVGRTLTLGICAVVGLLWSGCEPKPATEYVTGISTQVKVPRDIKAVRVQVTVGGSTQFCQGYQAYQGVVQLPRSLGTYANSASASSESAPITYTIVGVAEKDLSTEFFANCGTAPLVVGENQARVFRRSTQPYIPDQIRYIPMPLKYSCFDKQCPEDKTCKAGTCVDAAISREKAMERFPLFNPGLVDGSTGGCFDAKSCMAGALPALVVDRDKCIYAVANSPGAPKTVVADVNPIPPLPPGTPWDGTNVEVVYDGGLNLEVLDFDPEEGFSIPDPTKPQQFQLAQGLCDMVKGVDVNPSAKGAIGDACQQASDCKSDVCRVADPTDPAQKKLCFSRQRITSVRASGTCQSKRLPQPFCISDQYAQMGLDPNGNLSGQPDDTDKCSTIELKPPKSGLVIVADDTSGNANFFDPEQIATVDIPLSDPAFAQTDFGLIYAPLGSACATNAPPSVPLESATQASADIRKSLTDTASKLASGEPKFSGALASAYTLLLDPSKTYYKRAVLVVGNRGGDVDSCAGTVPTPTTQAAAALAQTDAAKKISTYVIQLVNGPGQTDANPLETGLAQLAAKGSAEGQAGSYDPDARGSKKANAKVSFQKIINSLATCVYDVPAAKGVAPDPGDIVSFSNPLDGSTTRVDYVEGCNGEGVGDKGWGFGASPDATKKRIFLCKSSCDAYQTVLGQVSNFSLLYGTPSLPVPVFAHKKVCDVK